MEAIVDPPIPLVETKYIVKYRYYLYNLILNEQVTIIIDYTNSEQRQIYQSIITLTGEQYAAWGQDDSYIQNIVLTEVDKLRNNGAFFSEVLPVAPLPVVEPVIVEPYPIITPEPVVEPVDNLGV